MGGVSYAESCLALREQVGSYRLAITAKVFGDTVIVQPPF